MSNHSQLDHGSLFEMKGHEALGLRSSGREYKLEVCHLSEPALYVQKDYS